MLGASQRVPEPVGSLKLRITRLMLSHFQDMNCLWRYPGVEEDRLLPPSCRHVFTVGSWLGNRYGSAACICEPIVRKRLNTGIYPQPCI
ncbi:hypothetical protein BDV11DRAFT_200794 [Aspergillus similis]